MLFLVLFLIFKFWPLPLFLKVFLLFFLVYEKKKRLYSLPYIFNFHCFWLFFFFLGNFGLRPIFYSIFRLYINFGSFFFFFSSVLCNLLFFVYFSNFLILFFLFLWEFWMGFDYAGYAYSGEIMTLLRAYSYSFSGIKLGNSYKFWICL